MADPKIKIRRSATPNKVPTTDQLQLGELAINTYEGKLYLEQDQAAGVGVTVVAVNPWSVGVGTTAYNTYFTAGRVGVGTTQPGYNLDVGGNINFSGNLYQNHTLFQSGSGVSGVGIKTAGGIAGLGATIIDFRGPGVTTAQYDSIAGIGTIFFHSVTSGSGGEANQNAFSNVAVSGQTTVAADSETDTLTLVAGSNMTITTNASNDTITFASSGGGGGGGASVTVSDSAPSSPSNGDLWFKSDVGELYVYYADGSSNQWVESSGGASGPVTTSDTAPSNPGDGDLWWNSNTGSLKIYYQDADSSQWVDANAASFVQYWNSTSAGISTTQNVGIGTTNPQADLQVGTGVTVYGNVGIVSATEFWGDGSNLTGVISGIGIHSGGSIIGTGVTILNFVGTGNTFKYNSSTNTVDVSIEGGAVDVSDTPPSNPNAGDLWWESDTGELKIYYDDGNTEQWVDASGGDSIVQVGTGAPGNPQTGDLWWNSETGDLYVYYVDANTSQWVAANSSQVNYWLANSAGIHTTGRNVGIGTTNPQADLQVGTGVTVYGNSGIVSATTYYGSGANLTGIDATQIQTGNTSVQTIDTGSDGHIKLITEGTERVRIDSSGHVGIGTIPNDVDSIGKALNIASSTGGAIYLQDTDAPTTKFAAISYNGGTAALQIHAHHSSSYIDLGTNGTERVRITSSGNLQVGTAVTICSAGNMTLDKPGAGIITATKFVGQIFEGVTAGYWGQDSVGLNTNTSVGVNTSTINDGDLQGIGNSFKGMYVSNGMMIMDNVLSGNHYIGTAFNGLMAGPVTIEGTLSVDGNYVVV